jgi:hypothetical protein
MALNEEIFRLPQQSSALPSASVALDSAEDLSQAERSSSELASAQALAAAEA